MQPLITYTDARETTYINFIALQNSVIHFRIDVASS